jgi:hypothetical protein
MFVGVTPIDISVAAVTARFVEPDSLPMDAVTVVVPGLIAVATPSELIEAIAVWVLLQLTSDERSSFEPSLYTPVAMN